MAASAPVAIVSDHHEHSALAATAERALDKVPRS